jgi:DnaJ-domain-containing protein 1
VNISSKLARALASLAEFGFIGGGGPQPAAPVKRKALPRSQPAQETTIRVALDLPDYYAMLVVEPEATAGEVHKAYRLLARRYHPDVSSEPNAQEKFIQINEAYDVLKDPEQRAMYDEHRPKPSKPSSERAA